MNLEELDVVLGGRSILNPREYNSLALAHIGDAVFEGLGPVSFIQHKAEGTFRGIPPLPSALFFSYFSNFSAIPSLNSSTTLSFSPLR